MGIDRIRASMARQGVGVREIARRVHYDAGYISRVLRGQQQPSAALLYALTTALSDSDASDRIAYIMERPHRLDLATVEALASDLATQRRADDVLGPRPLLPAAESHMETLLELLRNVRGPHHGALAHVVAEHVQFTAWLHAECRNDSRAVELLARAVDLADEVESGPLAAQALNFYGWLARQQDRPHAASRWFLAAYMSPGAHPAQRMGDAAQAAQQIARMGGRTPAERLLGEAVELSDAASKGTPPGTAYWLTGDFQHLSLGLAYLGMGNPHEAATHLRHGLETLPEDQQRAVWATEYREALAMAERGGIAFP